jgi:anti-anti-sigma regulatory factor
MLITLSPKGDDTSKEPMMAMATELYIRCPLEPSDQGAVQVSICGPMDARSVNRVRRVMRPLLNDGVRHVDIDLSGITEVETSALAAMILADRQSRACNGTFRLRAVSATCAEAMRRYHLFVEQLASLGPDGSA